MHELAITQRIVKICEDHADGRMVLTVFLQIGELSNVVPEAVEFCFEACARGSAVDGARLSIERVPGRGRCRTCAADFPVETLYDTCPSCGGFGIDIVSGEELRVKELEVA